MVCPIKSNSNKIELTMHTSCYWVLDLLCVISLKFVCVAKFRVFAISIKYYMISEIASIVNVNHQGVYKWPLDHLPQTNRIFRQQNLAENDFVINVKK